MRKKSPVRDSGLRRPESAPLPGFLRQMREKAGLTQRDLGSHLKRQAKFVHDCETGQRRVAVGEFIAWCEGCGAPPAAAMAAYCKLLGRAGATWDAAEIQEAVAPSPWSRPASPARDRKVVALLDQAVKLIQGS